MLLYKPQFSFVELDDVCGSEELVDKFRRFEARSQVHVVKPLGIWDGTQQSMQSAPRLRTRREQRPVIEPDWIPPDDLLDPVVCKFDRVVSRRAFDSERRLLTRSDVNGRTAGLETVCRLEQSRIEPKGCDGFASLLAKSVHANGAHQQRHLAESLEVNGEIQWGAAETSGIWKPVPQHFPQDQDARRGNRRQLTYL